MLQDFVMDDEPALREAVRRRDATADGRFFYAVLSTGVFCFPNCKARPARPENLRFFPDGDAAMRAGYRPCRRCRPDLPPKGERERGMVEGACRAIEAGCFDLAQSAGSAGLSPAQFGRVFRRLAGVTHTAYAGARRQHVAQASLQAGSKVTDAIYEAGFNSSGRFYEAADAMLGMTPSAWRAGGAGETIRLGYASSWLGRVLVAVTGRGVCAILIGDADAALQADLAARFPRASLLAGEAGLSEHLAAVLALIDAPAAGHELPLDIRGTAFQRRVWKALRDIPAGSTRSYGDISRQLGVPGAARAVAGACAANPLAVAVPCHRVVTGAGRISGYRWGVERKRALLDREA